MFKNSGKKIMGWVKFLFALNLVLAILAFAGGAIYICSEYSGEIQLIVLALAVLLVALAVYLLLVFFSLLSVYAFGELTQSNVEIQHTLSEIQLQLGRIQSNRDSVRTVPRAPERAPEPAPAPAGIGPIVEDDYFAPQAVDRPASYAYNYKAAAGAPAFPVSNSAPRAEENVLICSKCGAKHDPSATNCRYCANPLR